MKISNVVLKRYTAGKGKSLKWYEWIINPNTRESERVLRYAECTAVIDTNQLDGNVMEIPYEEYKEWWDNNRGNLKLFHRLEEDVFLTKEELLKSL